MKFLPPPPPHNINSINYFNKSLTPDQKETIQKALSSPTPIYLIQGPPGTGKTTVIAELIAQYTAQGKKIWLTSQSNLAVDNVLERLPKDERIFPTRIGSEDKIQNKLFANDSQVIDYFVRQYRGKIREFIDTYGEQIDKYISTYNEFMQIDKELNRLDSSIANAKQEANALIQDSFFKYIDSISKDCADLSILRSISKSMLKEQCERFHKFLCKQSQQNSKYSFLGKYASSDNPNEPNQQWQELWGKGEEARNKEIHTLMQNCIGDTPPNIIKQFKNHINANTANTKEQAQRLQDKIQEKISEQAQKRDTLAKRKDSIQSALENIAQSLGCGKNLLTQSTGNDFKANIKNLQEKLDMYRKLDSLQMPSNSNQLESTIQTIAQKLGLDIQTLGQMQKGFATNATTTNKKELKKTLRDIAKENSKNISEQELEEIANELSQSKQSAKASENSTRYANVIESIKECVNIYAATCNIDPKKLNTTQDEKETPIIFDVVIVDEVSKMNAIEMLLPMQRAKKLILVGDQHQLPPIFKEGIQKEEIEEMLKISDEVFDRYKNLIEHSKFTQFFEIFPDSAKSRLTTQFRMHPHIMEFINHFYNEKRLVCGLPNPDESRAHEFGELYGIGDRHILWIDSSTSREDAPEHSTSKRNMQEVEVIRKIIKDMNTTYKAHKNKHSLPKNKRKEIGVISFYGAQVGELRNIRQDKSLQDLDIDISTVDDFQGKEKDVIIVSLVRTDKGISHNRFIKDYRRVNVAFSRARQLLIVVACNEAFDRVALIFGDKEAKLHYQTMRQSQKCFVVNKKLKDIIHYKSSDYTNTDKPHKG